MKSALRGSYTPLITPFGEDGEIDLAAFEALVARQVEAGSAGVVVTGTSGEPTSLTPDERLDLFRSAVDVAAGRIEVVAATGSPNQRETLRLTEAAEHLEVDAVIVVAPGFVRPSQRGLIEHFSTVAERTALPCLIYNIPGRAAVAVEAETVERVAERRSNLVGLKHASPDLDHVTELLDRLGDDFRIFCGLESYSYPMLALGAAGLMSAVGNLLPERVADLCDAVARGDHGTALALHRALFPVNRAVFFDTNPVPLKHLMGQERRAPAAVRAPLAPLSDADAERVQRAWAATNDRLSTAAQPTVA